MSPDLLGAPDTRLLELRDPYAAPDPRFLLRSQALSKDYGGRRWRGLAVQVAALALRDHPLFTAEDVWCTQLRDEVVAWQRLAAVAAGAHHEGVIAAARAKLAGEELRLAQVKAQLTSAGALAVDAGLRADAAAAAVRILELLGQLKSARVGRDEDAARQMRALASLHALWRRVVQWREEMGRVAAAAGVRLARPDRAVRWERGRGGVDYLAQCG